MPRKMRYLNERQNGDYRYVRDFPTKLLRTIPSHPKQFSKELGLTSPALIVSFTGQWTKPHASMT
jgi:hypothetical protein